MCGIIAVLDDIPEGISLDLLLTLIDERGPDFRSLLHLHKATCGIRLKLKASVLHMRGDNMQKQPVIDDQGNVLMFNGNIYKFSGCSLGKEVSDTTFLAKKLRTCKEKSEIIEIISSIDGPFAFIYWHDGLNTLLYGRDIFGRKSLNILRSDSQIPLVISSVGSHPIDYMNGSNRASEWTEVDCIGIHSLKFKNGEFKKTVFKWDLHEIYPTTMKCEVVPDESDTEYSIMSSYLTPLNLDLRNPETFSAEESELTVSHFEEKLIQAVKVRLNYDNTLCLNCRQSNQSSCRHSKIALAFSGGIDSTLLAFALDKVVDIDETIDLTTVAFKDESPDRMSAGDAFNELRKLRPNRNWRLILCDINKETLQTERNNIIGHLILPCRTVVDDSLGCACWFISRCRGRAIDSHSMKLSSHDDIDEFLRFDASNSNHGLEIVYEYTSPASIIFAGTGIDEQLGGYSSHKNAWKTSGIQGLFEEVSFQMRRLSYRNMGRDDRTYSHHGRDVKLPFLDSDLVSFLNSLPLGLKMNLDESPDIGPKKILRLLAHRWGLMETSKRVKRAMQFGTRIAKLESKNEKGNDICVRLGFKQSI